MPVDDAAAATAADQRTALDPSTDPQVLAAIVQHRPDLRAAVAMNPATYPTLLEWLAGLDDPVINAALTTRAPATAVPRAPVIEARPNPKPPTHRRGRRRFVTLGLAVALVVALVAATVLVVRPMMVRGEDSGISLAPAPNTPTPLWTLGADQLNWSSMGEQIPEDPHFHLPLIELGPLWLITAGDGTSNRVAAAVDPETGNIEWENPDIDGLTLGISEIGGRMVCLRKDDVEYRADVVLLDPSSGEEQVSGVLPLQVWMVLPAGDDLVVVGTTDGDDVRIARYGIDGTARWERDAAPSDLETSQRLFPGSVLSPTGNTVMLNLGGNLQLFSLDGDQLWKGQGSVQAVDDAGIIYIQTFDGGAFSGILALSQSGEELWSSDQYVLPYYLNRNQRAEQLFAVTMDNVLVELDTSDGSKIRELVRLDRFVELASPEVLPHEFEWNSARALALADRIVLKASTTRYLIDSTSGVVLDQTEGIGASLSDGQRLIEWPDGAGIFATSLADGTRLWDLPRGEGAWFNPIGESIVLIDSGVLTAFAQ